MIIRRSIAASPSRKGKREPHERFIKGFVHASVAVVDTLQMLEISSAGCCLEPSVLAGDFGLVMFGCMTRRMGRRNGDLADSVHGDGSTSSRPPVLSEMPWMTKTIAGRLPKGRYRSTPW
jgi:hypothetical protein